MKISIILATITALTLGRAGTLLDFDAPPPPDAGARFSPGSQIIEEPKRGGVLWFQSKDAGDLVVDFDSPQWLVRGRLGGIPKSGLPRQEFRIAAFAITKDGERELVRSMAITADGAFDGVFAFCQPVRHAIQRIRITPPAGLPVLLDELEFDSQPPAPSAAVDFEGLPEGLFRGAPGFELLDPARPIPASTLGTTAGSGTHVLQSVGSGETAAEPLRFRLDPPQGFVAASVGYPLSLSTGGPGHPPAVVTMTAFNTEGAEIGWTSLELPEPGAIVHVLEICRLPAVDISRVDIEFDQRSILRLETIDDLVFGPVPVPVAPDVVPPVIRIAAPGDGVFHTVLARSRVDSVSTAAQVEGSIEESGGLESVAITIDNALGRTSPPVRTAGEAPHYRFFIDAPLAPGTNAIRIDAFDRAGNRGTRGMTLVVAVPGPLRITGVEPWAEAAGGRDFTWELRRGSRAASLYADGSIATPTGRLGGPAIREPRWYRIAADSLHPDVRFHLRLRGWAQRVVSGELPLREVQRTGNSVVVEIPEIVFTLFRAAWDVEWTDFWSRPGAVPSGFVFGGETRTDFSQVYGLSFPNSPEMDIGVSTFVSLYRDTLFLGTSSIANPSRMLFLPVFLAIMAAGTGHCHGLCVVDQWMIHGDEERFFGAGLAADGAAFPAGLMPPQRPARYVHRELPVRDLLGRPVQRLFPDNLWANVEVYHASQLSSAVLGSVIRQMRFDGFGTIGGDPREVLETVRRAPQECVLTLIPSLPRAHVVLPYRVEDIDDRSSVIHVFDSNFPSQYWDARNHPDNLRAVRAAITIDRIANRYRFCFSRADAPCENVYEGNGIYVLPMSNYRGELSPPGISDLVTSNVRAILSAGSHPEVTDPDGSRAGVDAAGVFLPGTRTGTFKAVPLTSATQDKVAPVIVLGSGETAAVVRFHRDPGARTNLIHVVAHGATVQAQIDEPAGPGPEQMHLVPAKDSEIVRLVLPSAAARLTLRLGWESDPRGSTPEAGTVELTASGVEPGIVEIRLRPGARAYEIGNLTGGVLHFRQTITAATTDGTDARNLDSIVAPRTVQAFTLDGWPGNESLALSTRGVDPEGSSQDSRVVTAGRPAAPAILSLGLCLRVSGEPQAVYDIEGSEDLKSWRPLGSVRTSGDGEGVLMKTRENVAEFYRAVRRP